MIDLHTHSTASDGSCTPERLIDLAVGQGLSALALTDHDTLDGLPRARARAEGSALSLLPGVEIEIECETGEFHLLGLGMSGDLGPLSDALTRIQVARRGTPTRRPCSPRSRSPTPWRKKSENGPCSRERSPLPLIRRPGAASAPAARSPARSARRKSPSGVSLRPGTTPRATLPDPAPVVYLRAPT